MSVNYAQIQLIVPNAMKVTTIILFYKIQQTIILFVILVILHRENMFLPILISNAKVHSL